MGKGVCTVHDGGLGSSRCRLLLLFDGFFRWERVLLLSLSLLQLALVEVGDFIEIGFVRHGCKCLSGNQKRAKLILVFFCFRKII